ncbi:MAG: alkaline phosphatase family protein [Actinomycetota bacterium]|nr:alkaline phosphatase family protein [Actinomycetota bacterium]
MGSEPVPTLPAYGGACLSSLLAGLTGEPGTRPAWVPQPVAEARQVVLLVVDGLGWEQLVRRRELAPTLASMAGGPITSVAPTTTATALTSITSGVPPALHGVVGYRVRVEVPAGEEVLNVLKWTTPSGDARRWVPPAGLNAAVPFAGRAVPVVSSSAFRGSGFSESHLRGGVDRSWHSASGLAVEVRAALTAGEPFVYAYYDAVDKVAHAAGLGAHYEAELRWTDRLVAELLGVLPPGAALAVTADHGQVEVGSRARPLDRDVLSAARMLSGEARFRWFHARPGAQGDLRDALVERYGGQAWVRTVDELDAEGWYGGALGPRARARLGDVALVPWEPVGYLDPDERNGVQLVCRHGSLTAAEVLVPLLGAGP